ncbi:MAG: universal stress protein [Pseudohongiellaceae bacterium]
MFDKALAALDLSPAELPLLDCLPFLRKWGVHHLVLTHIIRVGYGQGAALAHEQDYIEWLEQSAIPLGIAGLSVEVKVQASGEPARAILAIAEETAVDLIIIGSRGQNRFSKMFLGSVAREVIRATTKPLLLEWIEPTEQATQARCNAVCIDTLAHIIFATDFSERSLAAEQIVLALAPVALHIECIHVLPVESDTAADRLRLERQIKLDALVASLKAAGGKVSGKLLQGLPATEIAAYAEAENASLMVVGKHGQNWLTGKIIGSTAAKICESAGRPVLMVPG